MGKYDLLIWGGIGAFLFLVPIVPNNTPKGVPGNITVFQWIMNTIGNRFIPGA